MKSGPEIDPTLPEYIDFVERLTRRLELYHGRSMTDILVAEIDDAIDRLRRNTKLELPKLTALILRDLGVIEVVRADLTRSAVANTMMYLKRKYGASDPEILWAVARSFPHYFPGRH